MLIILYETCKKTRILNIYENVSKLTILCYYLTSLVMDGVKPDDGDEGFAEDNTPDDELVPMDVNLTAGAEGEGSNLFIKKSII